MYAEPTHAPHAETRAFSSKPSRSSDPTGDLQCLFKSYDAACLDFDADAVAAFYDLPCLISTPSGNGSFTARGELRMAFARIFSGYRCQGLVSASLVSLQIKALAADFAQSQVIWSLANARGTELASSGCAYTLRHAAGRWRIVHAAAFDEVLPQKMRSPVLSLTPRI